MITDSFIIDLLNFLKIKPTQINVNTLKAWGAAENTAAVNNPLATTWDMRSKGATMFNSAGVQNYPTQAIGIAATGQTLKQANFRPLFNILKDSLHIDENATPDVRQALNIYKGDSTTKYILATYATRFKNKPVNIQEVQNKATDAKKTPPPSGTNTIIAVAILFLFSFIILLYKYQYNA